MTYNIFRAYRNGQENLIRIAEEEAKLESLIEEKGELERLVEYYDSVEYKKAYARESWNLAEEGETLYYVDREDPIQIERLEINNDPIPLSDHMLWWKRLIFGS